MSIDLVPQKAHSEFQHRFFQGLIHDCYEYQEKNFDFYTFGDSARVRIRSWFKDKILLLAKRYGFVRKHFISEVASKYLAHILDNMGEMEIFYHMLQDDYSKQLLIELLKLRILTGYHVKLPLNDRRYWDTYYSIDRKFLIERRTVESGRFFLNRYQFPTSSGILDLHAHPLGILNTFILEQYAYQKGDYSIKAQEGEIIIDAGGCWGDVTLYFAERTGSEGKVYCFEIEEGNLGILRQNLTLNPRLADRIEIVQSALWNKSGETLRYGASGSSTSVVRGGEEQRTLEVSSLSIDDFVRKEGISRVDFIKMDIEGAELKALQGAEETIRTFKPKLAIALYHKLDDFITIPSYLDRLGVGYEFFLDHFTIHAWETVLFANTTA